MKKILNIFIAVSLIALFLNGCSLWPKKEADTTGITTVKEEVSEEIEIAEDKEVEEEIESDVEADQPEEEEIEEPTSKPKLPSVPTPPKITQIDLILDASGSMWGQIEGKSKIEIAKEAMSNIIDDLKGKENLKVGLRIYGHLSKECTNSVLEIPIDDVDAPRLKEMVNSIKPLGSTPIAYSLEKATNDFSQSIEGEKVIILVTDGIESCNGDPCAAAKKLKEAGVVTKIHVVGFGLKEGELDALKCIAEPFDGLVVGADNAEELMGAFEEIIQKTLDTNLEIIGKNEKGEDVHMDIEIFKDSELVTETYGTTLSLFLPEGNYEIKATASGTGAVQWVKNVNVKEDELTRKEIIFDEGYLKIKGFDSEGNPLGLYGYLYHADDEQNSIGRGGWSTELNFTVAPGVYSLAIENEGTSDVMWFKNIEVKSGELIEKEADFAEAYLTIKGFDPEGQPLSLYGYLYPADDEQNSVGRGGWSTELNFTVVPGVYSIYVEAIGTGERKWIRNINLEARETVEKEAVFAEAYLTIKGFDPEGQPLSLYGYLYKADDEQNTIKRGDWSTELNFTVVPGVYSIYVEAIGTGEKKWIRNINLEAGEKVTKDITF